MENLQTGNVGESALRHRQWIMGEFYPENSPFHTGEFEIKWGVFRAGEHKAEPAADNERASLAINVRGKSRMEFPELHQSVMLEKEGDYVYWQPGVLHTWSIEEDSLIITVRWRQKNKEKISPG